MSRESMDVTGRFSDRVVDYDLYRPSYPAELLDYLDQRVGLRGSRVADVGAGTAENTGLASTSASIITCA